MSFLLRLLGLLILMSAGYILGVVHATGPNPEQALAIGQYMNANFATQLVAVFGCTFLGATLFRIGLTRK